MFHPFARGNYSLARQHVYSIILYHYLKSGKGNTLTDFTTITLDINTGTDASPTWTHTIAFGTAGNELRAALSTGSQTTSTASASWPSILKPASGTTLIDAIYGFTADTTGFQVATYDGTTAHYKQFRVNWDNVGTFASAPLISAWKDNTLPAASPGTQPGTGDGSSIVNGTSAESSSTSFLKANAYGQGVTTGGAQQTPSSNAAGTLAVTSGTAGAVNPGSAAWLATWQSLQAATQYIQDGVTPAATTAGFWYVVAALWIGAGLTGGTLLPVVGFQYTWI